MNQPDDSSEKSHEPTEKKLRDARQKGEIIRSNDVSTAAAYLGLWLALSVFGANWILQFGTPMTTMLADADRLGERFLSGSATYAVGAVTTSLTPPLLGLFGAVILIVMAAIFAQQGFVFAPSKLTPKLNRISLITNAKNKFGRAGLFEFFKSFLKLTLYSFVLGIFVRQNLPDMVQSAALAPVQSLSLMGHLLIDLLTIIVIIAAGLAVIDYMFQRAEFYRRNRMTHKELRDEMKEMEGDPTLKSERRARAEQIATNKMLADVPKADVVIVNPTHYAVALAWDRTPGSAPRCVAKGVDEIALRIREIATEFDVPIHQDAPTARALHAGVEIGDEIAFEHFAAVAIAIRYAEKIRRKMRHGG